MSTPLRAFAALVISVSAAIAAPLFVADPTLGEQVATECSPTCGNGRVQPSRGEVCDDGNNVGGDGCSADCRSEETCGNGIVDAAAGEQCDTSGETALCNDDCTVAYCGDGKVNASRGESCDTAGPSETCNVFCQPRACGNFVVEAPFEQCDDGNTNNNDACTNQCQISCSL